jgi:hypothetical protein
MELYYGYLINTLLSFKIYTGTTCSYFQGEGNRASKQKDYNIFELRRVMYGCELVIFKGFQNILNNHDRKKCPNKNTGAVSVYYESCNFSNSTLYFYDGSDRINISLKRFASPSFLHKYKNEVSWGG